MQSSTNTVRAVARQDELATWWKNAQDFLTLAHKFLAPSVHHLPDRLFSTASDIITDHHCHLLLKNWENLVFLEYNSHLFYTWHLDYHLMLSDSFNSFWLCCCFTLILKSGPGYGRIWVHKSGQIRLRPAYLLAYAAYDTVQSHLQHTSS